MTMLDPPSQHLRMQHLNSPNGSPPLSECRLPRCQSPDCAPLDSCVVHASVCGKTSTAPLSAVEMHQLSPPPQRTDGNECRTKSPEGTSITTSPASEYEGNEKSTPPSASTVASVIGIVCDDEELLDAKESQCDDLEGQLTNPVAKNKSLLVPCVSMFSSNYNFSVLAVAMFIMSQGEKYAEATKGVSGGGTLKMVAYAGAVVGQFTMGYMGDLIGRKKATLLTLFLVVFGAIGSAVCTWGSAFVTFIVMGIFRFILGVGSGGVYPLSAVSAAEGTASSKAEDRSPRVSIAYCFNVPGIILPYVLAAILWNTSGNIEVCFRVLLGVGALPAVFIMYSASKVEDSQEYKVSCTAQKLWGALLNRQYWSRLVGTGMCWFLYDVTSYGILLAQPEITQVIWGPATSVNDIIWQGIVLNCVGIPGAIMGILVIKQMGIKWLQFWGFVGLAMSSYFMAIAHHSFGNSAILQIIVLAVVNFFINWGAAITTFILPATVYPPECRSTYTGISAALGKIGAVVGILSIKATMLNGGIGPSMAIAGTAGLLGAVLTWFFVGQVPKTRKGAVTQCCGSLLGCIPFCDPRRKMGW